MHATRTSRIPAAVLSALLLLGAAACSDDDTTTDPSEETEQVEDVGATGGEADDDADTEGDDDRSDNGEEAAVDEGPCVHDLEIVNAAADPEAGVTDGPWEPVTMWADEGPHPANTVDYDSSLELGFFTYVQEPDPQFGRMIPIGDPDTPEGEHVLSLSLFVPDDGVVGPGQRFVDQLDFEDRPDADGEINHTFWEFGDDRLLPGDLEIVITELTDEQVCGTITTRTETNLQTFIGVEGSFVADRIQHLEALDES